MKVMSTLIENAEMAACIQKLYAESEVLQNEHELHANELAEQDQILDKAINNLLCKKS